LYYFLTRIYFSQTLAELVTQGYLLLQVVLKPTIKMNFYQNLKSVPIVLKAYLSWRADFQRLAVVSGTYVVKRKRLAKANWF
jgi:hypothetical protein